MEVQNDHGLLVVSLENCITSETCELGKTNSCIYTAAMSSGACGPDTSVVQLATPIQCIGDIRQTLPRIQHQHLAQLQPIQYSQTVSYEPSQQIQHNSLVSNHTLYQPMTVSTAPLHPYTPSNPTLHNPYMNNPTLPLLTTSPSFPNSAPTMEDIGTSTEPTETTGHSRTPTGLSEPTYPAEGFDYFLEIQNFLISEQYPPDVSDNYVKCLRKRAQNYLILNGKLYHNRKQPKEVIMRKDQQEDMLSDIHVVKETGVHLGVKKMFNKLHMKYFWRGMYTDVMNFVKKCDKCSDQLGLTTGALPLPSRASLSPSLEEESEDSEDVEDPNSLLSSPCAAPQSGRRFSSAVRVWRKVEVQLHGPYKKTCNHSEFIVTMADPDSRWCCARAVPGAGLSDHLSDFIFHEFCNFGFARCSLVGCSQDLCQTVTEEYLSRVTRLGEVFSSATLDSIEPEQSSCSWVDPLLDRLVQVHPTKWDKYLDHFLFQYRIGELKEFTALPFLTESPFSLLFYHSPLSFTLSDEDKENIDGNSVYKLRRRKPQSRLMQCRHCDSLFASKISFRIHQRKHQRGHLLGKKRISKAKDVNSLSRQPSVQPSGAWRESTVSAVKALLIMTKEERRRRGKYHKYTVELQEQMAAYAMKHGNQQAVRYFSERLGTVVSESTIRNLVKIYSAFTNSTKDEIGRFAVNYGVEPAAKFFSERLKRDVSQSLVRKFKAMYLSKRSCSSDVEKQREGQMKISEGKRNIKLNKNGEVSFRGKRYTAKIKQEIGEYASNHSVKDTVEHFTERLHIPVKERTVKRFYKLYLDKCQSQNQNNQHIASQETQVLETTNCGNQETVHVYGTFSQTQNIPVTLYQLNEPSTGNQPSVPCYQANTSSSVITSQSNYQTLQNFSSNVPTVTIPPPPAYPITFISNRITPEKTSIANLSISQENQQNQPCLIPQHSLLMTQDRGSPILPHFLAAQPLQPTILTLISEKESSKVDESPEIINRHEGQTRYNSDTYQEQNIPIVTDIYTLEEKQQDMLRKIHFKTSESSDSEVTETKMPTGKKQTKKKDRGSKKRGTYTSYSPEIRAEIGKYAAEYGSLKACQHFAKILGHDVPESTARGLREKYLMKKKHCQVTSLGYSQRGRPLRLGKYDELVQECLKELVRSGEKVSSFLAITTAKEILNKFEPELLEENGGCLKLNTTWAKSFLKRIGVHNNS